MSSGYTHSTSKQSPEPANPELPRLSKTPVGGTSPSEEMSARLPFVDDAPAVSISPGSTPSAGSFRIPSVPKGLGEASG